MRKRKYLSKRDAAKQVYVRHGNLCFDPGRGHYWQAVIVCKVYDYRHYHDMVFEHVAMASAVVREIRARLTRPKLSEDAKRKKELRHA